MSALALSGGTWTPHRGIRRWTPNPEPGVNARQAVLPGGADEAPDKAKEPRCRVAPAPGSAPLRPLRLPSPTRAVCPIDGCLLTHPDETCPACLVWAERDAIAASWRRPAA